MTDKKAIESFPIADDQKLIEGNKTIKDNIFFILGDEFFAEILIVESKKRRPRDPIKLKIKKIVKY